MYSIIYDEESKKHSFDSFKEKFLQICEEHKKSDRALAFAFILYNFEDAHVSKVLDDKRYVEALHFLSGKYLTVFYLHQIKSRPKKRQAFDPRTIQYITAVNFDSNPSEGSEELIREYFGKHIEVNYPAVLFFQVHEDKVIDTILIEFDSSNMEGTYNELKEYIAAAVAALKQITPENKGNSQEIFTRLALNVKGERQRKAIIRKIPLVRGIAQFFRILQGFA